MPRKPSAKTLKPKAAALLQKLVRMKAADAEGWCECVTCGKRDHYKAMDGGHFVSRQHTAHLLREENIHPQCKRCNKWLHGALDKYTLYMVDMYGRDFVDHLIATKTQVRKYTAAELEDIIAELRVRIKDQAIRLNEE